MHHSHPIDRLAVKLRPAMIVLAALAFPVFLISYGWMIVLAFYAWPGWAFAIAVASQVVGWLGISALLDKRIDG